MLLEEVSNDTEVLTESSTIARLLPADLPNKNQFLKTVHTYFKIPHDAEFFPSQSLNLANISGIKPTKADVLFVTDLSKKTGKKSHPPGAVMVTFKPVRSYRLTPASQGTFTVTAIDAQGNVGSVDVDTIPELKKIIKSTVGTDYLMYLARKSDVPSREANLQKIAKRKAVRVAAEKQVDLMKKFSPLFLRVMKQAEDELHGLYSILVKNRVYARASEVGKKIASLHEWITELEYGQDWTKGDLSSGSGYFPLQAIKRKILEATNLAAMHFYSDTFESDPISARAMLMKDIAAGKQDRLSAVLKYFKDEFLRFQR